MKARGKVKGQAIEFDEPLGLPEGQDVDVEITSAGATAEICPGVAGEGERAARRELLAKYGIRPIPARGTLVTSEIVNEIREELGI